MLKNLVRYHMREDPLGGWRVFDIFTGHEAQVAECRLAGMNCEDARRIIDLLNQLHPVEDLGTIH